MSTRVRIFYAAWIVAIFAIVVTFGAMAGRAKAADGACQPVSAVKARLAPILEPVHGEVVMLMGAAATAYLDTVNAEPPVTHLAGEGVLLVVVPGAAVTLGLIHDGIACAIGRIPAELHAKAMEAVAGHKA